VTYLSLPVSPLWRRTQLLLRTVVIDPLCCTALEWSVRLDTDERTPAVGVTTVTS
jgi:hypothetical protein